MTVLNSAKLLPLAALTLSLAAAPLAASASVFGANLIVNGGGEDSTGSSDGNSLGTPPGFTITGDFDVVKYTAGGGYPVAGDPGVSAANGANFFSGGNTPVASVYPALSTGSQTIDVSSGSAAIDLGTASYTLSALLGGYLTQDDNATLSITFLNGLNASVGSDSLGPVTESDRNGLTALLARSDGGFVPVGTRSINVLLTLSRFEGAADDGYADNLSLILTPGATGAGGVPEPASWALMLMGFGGLGAALRARRRGMLTAI